MTTLTVFYSWQTDTPSKVNRNFIEEALKGALKQINTDGDVVRSPRGAEVVLDKDTKGVPGTPPIVQTIFNKIDQCSVFVPDLTFVAKTDGGRQTPNANVLIEYGWALKSRSHNRIVAVMNEAFGAASEASLPFNIRHIKWPIRYELTADGSVPRAEVRKRLVDELAVAIREVLRSAPTPGPEFHATPSTSDEAVFSVRREALAVREGRISEIQEQLFLPDHGPKMFIRVMPTAPTGSISSRQAYEMITQGHLEPFTLAKIRGGAWYDMNKYGAISYRTFAGSDPDIRHLTQLFKSKELWGISCELATEGYRTRLSGFKAGPLEGGFNFVPAYYEISFKETLEDYLRFAKECCNWCLRFKSKRASRI